MTQMNIAIGVGRAIVKNKLLATSTGLANLLIELAVLPRLQHTRLTLRQIGAHREIGFRQI